MANSDSSDKTQPKSKRPRKVRLDVLLVERGLAESRERARRLIMAGEVLIGNEVFDKPGRPVADDVDLRVRTPLPYVSRGGLKLQAALETFHFDVTGIEALDVGASTGGFTDCLLQHGAKHIFAVDVGYGQLAWKLRTDPRVTVLERTNIRYLEELPGGVLADLAVVDASFISLELVLPPTLHLLAADGHVIALIKPQFEAGKEDVGKGGVVRDERVHRRVLIETIRFAGQLTLHTAGLTVSPLLGPAGNVEFLLWLRRQSSTRQPDVDALITSALRSAQDLHRV